jgi:hypothetical protein
MTNHVKANKVSPSLWRHLVGTLSLELTQRFYAHLGVPIKDKAVLRDVSETIVREHAEVIRGVRRPIDSMVSGYLEIIRQRFGEEALVGFMSWILLVWNQLKDESWDWFAYEMVFGRWRNYLFSARHDLFGFGQNSSRILEIFEEHYIEPTARFRIEKQECRRQSLSSWDEAVFTLVRFRLTENGDEDLIDVFSHVSVCVSSHHFLRFWSVLLAQIDPVVLSSIHTVVERIVREETCYPEDRALPEASKLLPPSWINMHS